MTTELENSVAGNLLYNTSDPENRQIFDWIETMVGSHFNKKSSPKDEEDPKDDKVTQSSKFSLVEFELGKDEPSEDDLLRCSLGEGMAIPLRVLFKLDNNIQSNQLLMRLPTYFYDFAEDINNGTEASILTVHTHETYFYSTILKDIEDFIRSEGHNIQLAIPECYYVKHCPKYQMRQTPALIDNILEAKSLIILDDLKAHGFKELESVEDVDLHEGVAVMTQIAKIHAVTWAMEQKTGKRLNDVWTDLLSVVDQEVINDHVIEGSFEFFQNGLDDPTVDTDNEDKQLYAQLTLQRSIIEGIIRQTLYASGPEVPNCLLHMMIGGPNLFFRKRGDGGQQQQYDDNESQFFYKDIDVFISNWSLCTVGNPILDIALFSCISLTPEVRQRCTSIFLEQYWQIFMSTATKFKLKPQFDYKYICKEFEKFQIWCFLFMVAACKRDEMKVEEIRDILQTILKLVSKLSTTDTQ